MWRFRSLLKLPLVTLRSRQICFPVPRPCITSCDSEFQTNLLPCTRSLCYLLWLWVPDKFASLYTVVVLPLVTLRSRQICFPVSGPCITSCDSEFQTNLLPCTRSLYYLLWLCVPDKFASLYPVLVLPLVTLSSRQICFPVLGHCVTSCDSEFQTNLLPCTRSLYYLLWLWVPDKFASLYSVVVLPLVTLRSRQICFHVPGRCITSCDSAFQTNLLPCTRSLSYLLWLCVPDKFASMYPVIKLPLVTLRSRQICFPVPGRCITSCDSAFQTNLLPCTRSLYYLLWLWVPDKFASLYTVVVLPLVTLRSRQICFPVLGHCVTFCDSAFQTNLLPCTRSLYYLLWLCVPDKFAALYPVLVLPLVTLRSRQICCPVPGRCITSCDSAFQTNLLPCTRSLYYLLWLCVPDKLASLYQVVVLPLVTLRSRQICFPVPGRCITSCDSAFQTNLLPCTRSLYYLLWLCVPDKFASLYPVVVLPLVTLRSRHCFPVPGPCITSCDSAFQTNLLPCTRSLYYLLWLCVPDKFASLYPVVVLPLVTLRSRQICFHVPGRWGLSKHTIRQQVKHSHNSDVWIEYI